MPNQESLISIVLIFFNEERFIQESIESVLAQTYTYWELLLVDDGSSDGSTGIAQSYSQRYPHKIKYLEHKNHQNLGMSSSRNLGFQHSEGEYICFLDADDVWLPLKLEQQFYIMQEHNKAAFVCGRTIWWYAWANQSTDLPQDFAQEFSVPSNTLVQPPQLLLMFLEDEWLTLHDLLIRREAIETVGGYEDSFTDMYEDQVFHAKLGLNFEAFISDKIWCKYRQHEKACTSESHTSGRYLSSRKKYLLWLKGYLQEKDFKYTQVSQVLQEKLFATQYPRMARFYTGFQTITKPIKALSLECARRILPEDVKHWLWAHWSYKLWPPVGFVNFGHLRRPKPLGQVWPNHRGAPVDRYYIEKFLSQKSKAIQGHVLELGDDTYTKRFGGEQVTSTDVLHAIPGNPAATIVADLTCAEQIPSDTFDCIIFTQALLLIYDVKAALRTIHRILKPGGTLLVTVPGITQIIRNDMEQYGQYWSFTEQSVRKLLEEVFTSSSIETQTFGNVLTTTAFLYNLAIEDLSQAELEAHDPDYQLIIAAQAVKE